MTVGKYIPLTFIKYCIVGSLGVIVHVTAYYLYSSILQSGPELNFSGFSLSLIGAIETAIIFNFTLNNLWTFANNRLRGKDAFIGFLKFNIACAFGALASYAVSAFLFTLGWAELACVIIGAFTGVIWNYTMNRLLTWRER